MYITFSKILNEVRKHSSVCLSPILSLHSTEKQIFHIAIAIPFCWATPHRANCNLLLPWDCIILLQTSSACHSSDSSYYITLPFLLLLCSSCECERTRSRSRWTIYLSPVSKCKNYKKYFSPVSHTPTISRTFQPLRLDFWALDKFDDLINE